tara:strand:- start:11049 stop:11846 length:798 start_codon:yes stop_codon:yes gene_type:complete
MKYYDPIKAFGGGRLKGDKLMRFAHIDEAGTSAKEDWCVVAGVISSPDGQWRQLNNYLAECRKEFCPDRPDIIFHAKDIFHGTKDFHRDNWSREKRAELLTELSKIPWKFSLPVIGSTVDKSKHKWEKMDQSVGELQSWHYALAFGMCVVNFEGFMRGLPDHREVGTVIAEDVPHMRRYAKFGYERISEPTKAWKGSNSAYLPIERVVEEPLFSRKQGSALLQIADTVAFLIGRHRNGKDDVECYIDHFRDQIYELPHHREGATG